jgi:hypothetical protein
MIINITTHLIYTVHYYFRPISRGLSFSWSKNQNIEKEKTHAPVQVYLHNTLNPTHIPREARREQRVYPSRPQPKGAIKDWACCFYVQILVWICTKQTDNYYLFWCFRMLPFFLFDWNVADLAQWNNNDFPFQEIKRGLLFHYKKYIHCITIHHHHHAPPPPRTTVDITLLSLSLSLVSSWTL